MVAFPTKQRLFLDDNLSIVHRPQRQIKLLKGGIALNLSLCFNTH